MMTTVAIAATCFLSRCELVFEPDAARLVGVWRGKVTEVGRFALNGTFQVYGVHYPHFYSGPHYEPVPLPTTGAAAYELRGRHLIPGTFSAARQFVPTPGGTVVPFATYRPGAGRPPVWNLPGQYKLRYVPR